VENSLKQRLIGAVVLMALAIVFLPAILKEKSSNGTFQSQIPEKPTELQEYKLDTRKIDKIVDNKKSPQQTPNAKDTSDGQQPITEEIDTRSNAKGKLPVANELDRVTKSERASANDRVAQASDSNKTSQAAIPPKTINQDFKEAAWIVQVASFSSQENANKLVERLKTDQLKAYNRKTKSKSGVVYRVLVGPYVDKGKANKAISKITKVSETDALLKVFDPLIH
jgi:DedD protein